MSGLLSLKISLVPVALPVAWRTLTYPFAFAHLPFLATPIMILIVRAEEESPSHASSHMYQWTTVILSLVLGICSTLVVGIRMWQRAFVQRNVDVSDWFALAALVSFTAGHPSLVVQVLIFPSHLPRCIS